MDYEKMMERLQDFRQEIASEARFAYTHLYQMLSNCKSHVNADMRYQIADSIDHKIRSIGDKLESIYTGGEASTISSLTYDDKTNALLYIGNLLCDPKVRENPILSDYLEGLYLQMFVALADHAPGTDETAIKHYIAITSRIIKRRDFQKVIQEVDDKDG